ncbi:hypothetical protein [Listeria fleischmannii]|uniref:hypothetical protein n=1 Tax=Listeria fleischmannii TaxID=1069827 RepID=UPI000DF93983|nr:hypothetical protein [Listeria fleischmannii]STY35373.1 Uncharacterised protein [Listeria fleischmannii subsp. coloradonensis]
MKRILASLYMCFVKLVAFLCRRLKRQNKMVMLITFSDSPEQISKKMVEMKVTPETIVFYDPRLDTTKIAQNFMRMIPMTKKRSYRVFIICAQQKLLWSIITSRSSRR